MKDAGSSKQITTMTFIGMTCALVASVRNIPDVAATSNELSELGLIHETNEPTIERFIKKNVLLRNI